MVIRAATEAHLRVHGAVIGPQWPTMWRRAGQLSPVACKKWLPVSVHAGAPRLVALASVHVRRLKPFRRLITSLMPDGASSVFTAAGASALCCCACGIVAPPCICAGLPVA